MKRCGPENRKVNAKKSVKPEKLDENKREKRKININS